MSTIMPIYKEQLGSSKQMVFLLDSFWVGPRTLSTLSTRLLSTCNYVWTVLRCFIVVVVVCFYVKTRQDKTLFTLGPLLNGVGGQFLYIANENQQSVKSICVTTMECPQNNGCPSTYGQIYLYFLKQK